MNELERLKAGFRKFRKHYFEDNPDLYRDLVEKGQSPVAMVISCCDSRAHPAQVMDTKPGDIFVVRNVANVVPPCENDGKSHGTSAAIEFAVKHLKVKHIIVFGHSQCGGVQSLMEGEHAGQKHGFIDPWMAIVAPAREKVLNECAGLPFEDQCRACEKAVIEISLGNLKSFPWVMERVDRGTLSLHGWYFDIGAGMLHEYTPDGFHPLD